MKIHPPTLIFAAAIALAGCDRIASPAKAENACFQFHSPAQDSPPILLNQCSGETWILVKDNSEAGFRWQAISIGKTLYYDAKGNKLSEKRPDGWSIKQTSP